MTNGAGFGIIIKRSAEHGNDESRGERFRKSREDLEN